MRGFMTADGLNIVTRRGGIGTSFPVFGLRPIGLFFLRTTNEPNNLSFTVSPRSRQSVIALMTCSTSAADSACDKPAARWTASYRSARPPQPAFPLPRKLTACDTRHIRLPTVQAKQAATAGRAANVPPTPRAAQLEAKCEATTPRDPRRVDCLGFSFCVKRQRPALPGCRGSVCPYKAARRSGW
jgi:hypothetical protein